MKIPATGDLGLVELHHPSPLVVQLLPTGAVFALRHGGTLINQVLPGPAEDGLFRLLVRWRDETGAGGWSRLTGPGLGFAVTGTDSAVWRTKVENGLQCTTVLQFDPRRTAWTWRVRLRNAGPAACTVDVLHAQDLGLADEGAVRNNEAYTSHYIDLLPVRDADLGWVILARQNLAMAGGHHPWLALGCTSGAEAYCTDGWQFFGSDHRLTGEPAAVRMAALPSRRLQYEFALAGLQSRPLRLAAGASVEVAFLGRYLPDHPEASAPADVAELEEIPPSPNTPGEDVAAPGGAQPSLFITAPWLHGDRPTETDWAFWFPGGRRHEERDPAGHLLSFFSGADTHVVARDKEAAIARPHGHLLRSGDARWIDGSQFGLTCYAAGIFAAQAYLGNPGIARLLPVVRNALNLGRGGGQRVFLRQAGAWRQLGVPSAFAMAPGDVRWIYRLGPTTVEARVWCAAGQAAAFLELRVTAGPRCEFLVTHSLALGPAEFDQGGDVEIEKDGAYVCCRPESDGLVGRHLPGAVFVIAATERRQLEALGGDELLYPDGVRRNGPYVALRTGPVAECGIILLGLAGGKADPAAVSRAVTRARADYAAKSPPAQPPAPPVRLARPGDPEVARVDEILPWFTHNAAIHFSAPHGLEQYGGGAWGVRDVCQGSLEWLLAAGEFGTVRRLLETVFAQQYAPDGTWPQWFMPPPFQFIQQAHSHGDICFWPVKALCDYVEASNDLAFPAHVTGYTDPREFGPVGPREPLWAHCDRVIAHCRSRFLPGTALVNYGDGDWDDTLQPADPAMSQRLVSAWTVGLAFQTFRQLAEVSRRAGEAERAGRLDALCADMARDFGERLMPGGVVAGFLVTEADGSTRPLLHPADAVTRIRHRLLPMTRAIIGGLFTPEQARRHQEIIAAELTFPDGVRLMSEPAEYRGGCERLFRRAETAANVGREVGLQYVHAHLRYAEALARLGEADALWHALQQANPVGLAAVVPQAAPRQSNVYFSSSDPDFADRYEAAARWPELRAGRVAVRGGWRLYSSGPGLFLHAVRASLLGVRESFDDLVIDPVLPRRLDGLRATTTLCGRPVELRYRIRFASYSPRAVAVNGVSCDAARRESNPYRPGGLQIPRAGLELLLRDAANTIEIDL